MEVYVAGIPFACKESDVLDYFERILHGAPYSSIWSMGYPMNFTVQLHRDRRGNNRSHGGTGVVQIPDVGVAQTLIRYSGSRMLPQLSGRHLNLKQSKKIMESSDIQVLRSTPYEDSLSRRQRQKIAEDLSDSVPINALQFGWFDRDQVFSPEWTRQYSTKLLSCSVEFDAEKREVHIEETTSVISSLFARQNDTPAPRRVVLRVSNVESLSHSREKKDPHHAIVFTLYSPPSFDQGPPATFMEDPSWLVQDDPIQKRTREQSMDDSEHIQVVPFTSLALCVITTTYQHLEKVLHMAKITGLPEPTRFLASPECRNHFTRRNRDAANRWIRGLPWAAAFQCSALIYNWKLSAKELLLLKDQIEVLLDSCVGDMQRFANVLQLFSREIQKIPWFTPGRDTESKIQRTILKTFQNARISRPGSSRALYAEVNDFLCYHINIMPTSIRFIGPEPDQSNRVIRRYKANQDAFLRVQFTDEERFQYRWDREINGEDFVKKVVGTILKNPLIIAGRSFDFLAYSNSALKEHAVWFVAPFELENGQQVTADSIRLDLGNFDKVIRCPARYGARISQAFTATNVAVTARAEEIIEIPDIEAVVDGRRIIFTDGIGTCSRALMDMISRSIRNSGNFKRRRKNQGRLGAVQIRLGGSKGVLTVDHQMTEENLVLTRPSMNKYESPSLDIEVADTFEQPKLMYLNRPLIMILETLGVPIQAFVDLQAIVISDVTTAVEELASSAQLLDKYGLGTSFRLSSVFNSLRKLGLTSPPPDDGFLSRGLNFVVNDVLRLLKHKAKIHVPNSWTLVGVADIHKYLKEGEIFACIRESSGRKKYLQGPVLVTRSPACHPGDVQMAHAIGKPPRGSPFEREDLPNCCVFACRGKRSLPQSLGGGDLDGDLYNLVQCESIFPLKTVTPGEYPPTILKQLPEGERCTISDVADFVVDFLNQDRLGMISIQYLYIADQSEHMALDPDCILLSQLANIAVDFQKSGVPADLRHMPRARSKAKPDWNEGEVLNTSWGKPYRSRRALGVLFRRVELPDLRESHSGYDAMDDLAAHFARTSIINVNLLDPISRLIAQELQDFIPLSLGAHLAEEEIIPQFQSFAEELQLICVNCSIRQRKPLTEEECWAGTIAAKSSQPRVRQDIQARMREQTKRLVDRIRDDLSGAEDDDLQNWLTRTWVGWKVSRAMGSEFGAKSYGYIVLGSMFECLKSLRDDDSRSYHR